MAKIFALGENMFWNRKYCQNLSDSLLNKFSRFLQFSTRLISTHSHLLVLIWILSREQKLEEHMASSSVKGLIMRSNAKDVYLSKLMKQKCGEKNIDLLRAIHGSIHLSQWSGKARVICCKESHANAHGFTSPIPKRSEPPVGDRTGRSQAILSPISDPKTTTKSKKVLKYHVVRVCLYFSSL